MTTSTTIEFEHPYKEGLNGVVGKSTTKRISLLWAYGKHLKNYEVTTSHSRKQLIA